jgi:rubrerythrin
MHSFDEVMDIAIAREKDAVLFYQDLQNRSRFAPQKSVLKEFELMELGHVRLLEGVKERQSIAKLSQKLPDDLQLSDYLHDVKITDDMTYQQILIAAMKKEERAAALYSVLRDQAEDAEIRDVFAQLVVEEKNHKNHFESLYDRDIQGDN